MPKRKHQETGFDATDSDNTQLDRALRIRKSRLEAKFDQGATQISRALKLARGFERQKLGRRQKTAKSKKDGPTGEGQRLEEEVAVLKVDMRLLLFW